MDFLKGKIRSIYFRYLAAAFGTKRGSAQPDGSEDPYFTVSVLGSLGLALLAWAGLLWLEGPILTFFGADEWLLVLARRYLRPVKFVVPLFLFNQMLAAFLVSVARGLVLSGILILILPALRRDALWLAMPITETLTAVYAVMAMRSCTNALPMEA